jgi:hypothetical protein
MLMNMFGSSGEKNVTMKAGEKQRADAVSAK